MADLLTGTQRAAVRLALGVLRQDVIEHPRSYRWAHGAAWMAIDGAMRVLRRGIAREWGDLGLPRALLLRARLALYLRALLRADRDDLGGRWECEGCGSQDDRLMRAFAGHDPGPPCCAVACNEWTWHALPLWEATRPGVMWQPFARPRTDWRGWTTTGRWVRESALVEVTSG